MSEAMTVESLIDAYWQMRGFYTRQRFTYQPGDAGYYSDIDVLAYNARTNEMVFAESKAHGGKGKIKNGVLDDKYYKNLVEGEHAVNDDLHKFIWGVIRIVRDKEELFPNEISKTTRIIIHFVSTIYYSKSHRIVEKITEFVSSAIRGVLKKKVDVEVRIETHFDVLINLIEFVKNDEQGKRYGVPVLDIIRELNRHLGLLGNVTKEPKNRKKGKNQGHIVANKERIRQVLELL